MPQWVVLDPTFPVPNFYVSLEFPEIIGPHKILRVVTRVAKDKFWFGGFRWLNCVSIVKYITGIRLDSFTPWQLYHDLVNKKHPSIVSVEVIQNGQSVC